MRIRFLRGSIQDIEDARAHYAQQAPEQVERLDQELRIALTRIKVSPSAGGFEEKPYRRQFLAVFPYKVLYLAGDEEAIIVAVMHLKRRPGYWQQRENVEVADA